MILFDAFINGCSFIYTTYLGVDVQMIIITQVPIYLQTSSLARVFYNARRIQGLLMQIQGILGFSMRNLPIFLEYSTKD